jgi:hypothetical protein
MVNSLLGTLRLSRRRDKPPKHVLPLHSPQTLFYRPRCHPHGTAPFQKPRRRHLLIRRRKLRAVSRHHEPLHYVTAIHGNWYLLGSILNTRTGEESGVERSTTGRTPQHGWAECYCRLPVYWSLFGVSGGGGYEEAGANTGEAVDSEAVRQRYLRLSTECKLSSILASHLRVLGHFFLLLDEIGDSV